MLTLSKSTFGEDSEGNEVFMCAGDFISEISDAGPTMTGPQIGKAMKETDPLVILQSVSGWAVTVHFTPSHKQWTELVTIDAVKLLKALENG